MPKVPLLSCLRSLPVLAKYSMRSPSSQITPGLLERLSGVGKRSAPWTTTILRSLNDNGDANLIPSLYQHAYNVFCLEYL